MKHILEYSQNSQIMSISIDRGNGEIFKFNLSEEIKISEANIARELKEQPTAYGFLTMLHTELLRKLQLKKVNEKKAYAEAYLKHKKSLSKETGRPNSDDVAKQKAELDVKYLMAQKSVINTNKQVNDISNCVRAFEQRGSLLQTLSANKRSEKNN